MKSVYADNKMVAFSEETVNNENVTIVSYMIADSEFWKNPLSLECRGNVFDSSGNCICRNLPKFFNFNENPETQISFLNFDGDNITIFEKVDGSIINAVLINNKIYFKSKKSFESNVALLATKLATENIITFSNALITYFNCTPIFELTTKENKIVVDYPRDKFPLTILHARNIETGEFLDRFLLETLAKIYNVPIAQKYELSKKELLTSLETLNNFEGYVVNFKDTNRLIKFKTEWYKSLHHCMTAVTERHIVEMVINETIDDFKSNLDDLIKPEEMVIIENIETSVIADLSCIIDAVESIIFENQLLDKPFKEVATQYKNNEYFSLIMTYVRGKEPNYRDYFMKNIFKNKYGNKVVLNECFTKF